MSIRLVWSGVCVHCRARISGQVPFPIPIPTSFRQSCPSCEKPLTIALLEEGTMVAAASVYWRPYPPKP